MKSHTLFTLLLFACTVSFAQLKRPSTINDLPQTVINDFSRAVNYSWYYANNKNAFKGALIPGMQQQGVYSPFDIEKTIQDVRKSKSSRNLILTALASYTGISKLNQILLNINIPANSAKTLTAYAYKLQQQDASNNVSVSSSDISKSEYIVTAQKAYFYYSDNKGGIGQRGAAYLVEGEKFQGLKEANGYVYSAFTNSKTKKTTKGWISKMDIEISNNEIDEVQINSINVNSPFNSLKRYDGESQDVKKVYANPIITGVLRKIVGSDYESFNKNYLSSSVIGNVYVRHNVLYIKSFIAHNATSNASFFIDLKTGDSFLYWNTFNRTNNDVLKTYGQVPLLQNIVTFIQLYKANMHGFMDENEGNMLDNILSFKKGR